MPSPETLQAFALAAELGSFSAAARRMGKAQSAVSTAIANLEIDLGLTLFDRSARNPVLTAEGRAMLPHARGILLGTREMLAKAGSMAEGVEDRLGLALEQGVAMGPVMEALDRFAAAFPSVSLEFHATGPNDAGTLLKEGRADLGLMIEQEGYPAGFQFRGIGHAAVRRVCAPGHPLAAVERPGYGDLRAHRQIALRSRYGGPRDEAGKSASTWHAESPAMIASLVERGLGWAELPAPAVAQALAEGRLKRLDCAFQQGDELRGVDLVWTERRALGQAGQWLRDRLLAVPAEAWREG
ncbi:LysR family transcriptional regulator [Rhodovulum sp. DZ06]|uniref:LysR family transcriptional regulator n=1 Tax=Rhodovulum sp. DZ06 TaxID=3425126 RepID=UPI003D33F806